MSDEQTDARANQLTQQAYEQLLAANDLEQSDANCPFDSAQLIILKERGHHAQAVGVGEFYRQTAGPNSTFAYESIHLWKSERTMGLRADEIIAPVSWEDEDLYRRAWDIEVERTKLKQALEDEENHLIADSEYGFAQQERRFQTGEQTTLMQLLQRQMDLDDQHDAISLKERSAQAINRAHELVAEGKIVYLLIGAEHVNADFLSRIADTQFVVIQPREQPEATDEDAAKYYLDPQNAPN